MKTLGRNLNSRDHWEALGSEYSAALENDYHRHRLEVIRALLPDVLFQPERRIFDFGCGDAVLFPLFLENGVSIEGCDISEKMIDLAHARLSDAGYSADLVNVGGVDRLETLVDGSFDALLSFNVLAYLSDAEERAFYAQIARILRPGGFLIVTHSNELFDLFSLNRYTHEFFNRHFVSDEPLRERIPTLLTAPTLPEDGWRYNVRENPLTYRYKLESYGFREVQQEFINQHVAPPVLLGQRTYPNTLRVRPEEKWKLMFTCSTYGSRSTRLE